MAAATVAESDIRSWFEKIRQYLRDNNLEDVLTDPRRILNGDETMFLLDPGTKSVVASKGNRNVYLVQQADAKKNVTVLFTFDADGHMYAPDVILPYKRLSPQLCLSFDPDWGIGKSERGWMDGDNFVGHIQNKLHPSLVRRNVPFPVIYFVDGHSSHTGFEAAEACAELGIILIALYPNATHIMQPADVAMFKPLKNSWNKCVDEWKMQNDGRMLTILDFGGVLKKAINQGVSQPIVRSGFQKCGLYPYDADAVDYSRCLARSNQGDDVVTDSSPSDETVPIKMSNIEGCLRMFNTTRVKSFVGQAGENTLEDSEKALLHIYKSILMDYDEDGRINSANESGMNASIYEDCGDDNEAAVQLEPIVPLSSTIHEATMEFANDETVMEPLTVESNGTVEKRSPTADVTVETVNDWSSFEASMVSYDVVPITQHVMIVNPTSTPITEQPPETPEEGVLKDITNNGKPERRTSISAFFKLPQTPKRKNAKRNYSHKRHFVLTSAERMKEFREKQQERDRLNLEKELKQKERILKKELREQQKQDRMKLREEKKKERELEQRLKESKKVAQGNTKTLKPNRPKKNRKRVAPSDENVKD